MRSSFVSVVLATALVICSASAGIAQRSPATSGTAVTESLRKAWDGAKRNINESAELMPEANYAFKPVDTVRTFGQILAHIAGANYEFCSAAKGEKTPHAEGDFEKTATSRTQIMKVLADSMKYCDGAFTGLDDSKLADTVELPFNGGKGARANPLLGNINHLNEHYGNLVTYFRIKGMVPPSSRR